MNNSKSTLFKAVLLIAALAIVFYGLKASGFHIQGFSILKGGTIQIENVDERADIFIDNKKTKLSTETSSISNIPPGTHSIIVSQTGFWPWVKEDLSVASNKATAIMPFLVSRNVSGLIITREDSEYLSLRNKIEAKIVPTRDTPVVSEDTTTQAFVEDNQIIVSKDGEETVVLESESPIRNVEFYKDRNDVVLMSSQNGVFAIETDTRFSPQNFQPIYKGTALPNFIKEDSSTVYVLDGELLFLVSL